MEKVSKPYEYINFEISGKCNAKCKWCSTGYANSRGVKKGDFVKLTDFKTTIHHMLQKGIITRETRIDLFNWGEPLLHPEFKEIVEFLYEEKIFFGVSTNAGLDLKFDSKAFANLVNITFSCCGFTQKSYDRIHKLKLESVKNNIISIMLRLRKNNFKGNAEISYHNYQFNQGKEKKICQMFARENKIEFISICAYINDFDRAISYLKNKLPYNEMKDIGKDLFLFYVDENIEKRPLNYRCPQLDRLVIDENCTILPCCAVENEKLGFVVDNNLETIHNLKKKAISCDVCRETGLDYWAHNPMGNIENMRKKDEIYFLAMEIWEKIKKRF